MTSEILLEPITAEEAPCQLILNELEKSKHEPVPCLFLTGLAGSGKSYTLKQLIANNPGFGLLCSTTGISAINLNAATINSVLKYYDTNSLQQKAIHGKIVPLLKALSHAYDYICIDEVSMLDSEQLDILYESIASLNDQVTMKGKKLGLIITGDFCQLPTINGKMAFEAECWKEFEQHTVKLSKIWRQDNAAFIEALNYLRAGEGELAANCLSNLTTFHKDLDLAFDGTTIFAKNDAVDSFNGIRFRELTGDRFERGKVVRGFPIKEWDKIPEQLALKHGAYVMILANRYAQGSGLIRGMIYSNGDCGYVEKANEDGSIDVRLVRNDHVVNVEGITRTNIQKDEPQKGEWNYPTDSFTPYYDSEGKQWVLGEVEYMPLRLAYGSTVHKSQGLSLDRVQISFSERFFGHPSMMYVSVSRARTLEGLRLVGNTQLMKLRCNIEEKIRRFL